MIRSNKEKVFIIANEFIEKNSEWATGLTWGAYVLSPGKVMELVSIIIKAIEGQKK